MTPPTFKTVTIVKLYRRHGKLWIVYRDGKGRQFKQAYKVG